MKFDNITAGEDSSEKTQDIAVQALERIAQLGLEPIPHLYELWFRYFQGDPEIVHAIDTYTQTLDEVACHKLYKRYLGDAARGDAVRRIADQVQQAMSEVVSMLGTMKSATSEYSTTLKDAGQKLSHADSIEDLGRIMSVIVADTRRMVQENQKLELQLVNSSKQVSELRQNLDDVKREAMTDGMTGLYNRKAFDKQMQDCIAEARREQAPLVLLMLDIDHFKAFNDSFGHQTGDQVLRLVARALLDGIKGRDIAARYGGEEFAIILPDTTLSAGMNVADRLRKTIEGKEVVNKTNKAHLGKITLSIGVAEYNAPETMTDFIERADAALYRAKQGGRNQVQLAH